MMAAFEKQQHNHPHQLFLHDSVGEDDCSGGDWGSDFDEDEVQVGEDQFKYEQQQKSQFGHVKHQHQDGSFSLIDEHYKGSRNGSLSSDCSTSSSSGTTTGSNITSGTQSSGAKGENSTNNSNSMSEASLGTGSGSGSSSSAGISLTDECDEEEALYEIPDGGDGDDEEEVQVQDTRTRKSTGPHVQVLQTHAPPAIATTVPGLSAKGTLSKKWSKFQKVLLHHLETDTAAAAAISTMTSKKSRATKSSVKPKPTPKPPKPPKPNNTKSVSVKALQIPLSGLSPGLRVPTSTPSTLKPVGPLVTPATCKVTIQEPQVEHEHVLFPTRATATKDEESKNFIESLKQKLSQKNLSLKPTATTIANGPAGTTAVADNDLIRCKNVLNNKLACNNESQSVQAVSVGQNRQNLQNHVDKMQLGSIDSELISKLTDSVQKFPWFYRVDRPKAELILENYDTDGSFLVRECQHGGPTIPFTLTIRFASRFFHIQIRLRSEDGRFALGTMKMNEMHFGSVQELIDTYRKAPLQLHTNGSYFGETKLTHPPIVYSFSR